MRPVAATLALACALAAAPGAVLAQPGLAWETPDQGDVAGLLQLKIFHTNLINTGDTAGSYRVTMTVDAPPAWVTSMCEGTLCYAPFIREFDFTLAPGDTNDVGANITPVTDLGRALVGITVTSLDDPGLSATRSFTVVTPGLDVLIVDADALGDPVPRTAAALGALGKTAVAWAAKSVGAPDLAVLSAYPTVVWAAGASVAGIDTGGRAALADYVQQGGHLWLGGANLAFSLGSPASPVYTPASRAWLNDLAGADWITISANSTAVAGVPGDELGDGLALVLNGGDSAGNNSAPDVLATVGGGTACLVYGTGTTAGVRRTWGAGRVVL
ncbi:MAG: hypothetical protein IH621_11550, partial [Krumholzibacteria bacterium]|nr:hypothetical protein [Candidatus Krumholzibacteria bacterium]